MFDHLFVQNEKSRELLKSINVENVSVVGDTRFDRVIKILEQERQLVDVTVGVHRVQNLVQSIVFFTEPLHVDFFG